MTNIDRLREIAAAASRKTSEAKAKRIAKNTSSGWRISWDDAIREVYPEVRMTYSDVDGKRLKDMVRLRGMEHNDVAPFLDWIVRQWATLRRDVFTRDPRYPKGPATPVLKFALAYADELYSKYTGAKPEVAANLPLHLRRTAPIAAPAEPAKPAIHRIARPNPVTYAPAAGTKPIDYAEAERIRISLGLPKWKG